VAAVELRHGRGRRTFALDFVHAFDTPISGSSYPTVVPLS
jgi:hypothetical protein